MAVLVSLTCAATCWSGQYTEGGGSLTVCGLTRLLRRRLQSPVFHTTCTTPRCCVFYISVHTVARTYLDTKNHILRNTMPFTGRLVSAVTSWNQIWQFFNTVLRIQEYRPRIVHRKESTNSIFSKRSNHRDNYLAYLTLLQFVKIICKDITQKWHIQVYATLVFTNTECLRSRIDVMIRSNIRSIINCMPLLQ
jgi:hypothetical protein